MRKRVLVAMSGGVDSSVAAALLKEEGYEVVGASLRLFSQPGDYPFSGRRCCSLEDAEDARRVCHHLGIPFYYLNLEEAFAREVIAPFCQEYACGHTPNPCLLCNQRIKFRLLLDRALALGFDYLATGHYARIAHRDGRYHLLKGVDANKDQSYVLYFLGQDELHHILFPLGEYHKPRVRELARRWGLPVAEKAESQEICFARDLPSFLAQRLPLVPGKVVDTEGRTLGRHQGLPLYTVGQRRGLGLSQGERYYVLALDAQRNALVVGPEAALGGYGLTARGASFVSGWTPQGPLMVWARVRYRAEEAPALLWAEGEGARLQFLQPQRAITPGQAVAFYLGEELIGGSTIDQVISKQAEPERVATSQLSSLS